MTAVFQLVNTVLLVVLLFTLARIVRGRRRGAADLGERIDGQGRLLASHQDQINSAAMAIELMKQRTTWLLDRAMAERTAEWTEIDKALADFRVTKGLQELEDHLARIHEAHHPHSHEPGS